MILHSDLRGVGRVVGFVVGIEFDEFGAYLLDGAGEVYRELAGSVVDFPDEVYNAVTFDWSC